MLSQIDYPLIKKSKSKDAAYFQTSEKIKIPALENPFLFPFDRYQIAIYPFYLMNEVGFKLPDKASVILKLPRHYKAIAIKEKIIDTSLFKPVMSSHEIQCTKGCGIKDKIFIFEISHTWWYRLLIISLLVCLFIPIYIVWKSTQLSTAGELLALILTIATVRTLVLGYHSVQLFALDLYFSLYFIFWLLIQFFKFEPIDRNIKDGR